MSVIARVALIALAVLAVCAARAEARVVWSAHMETGDLRKWGEGSSQDTEPCYRSVTRKRAHRGHYSLRLRIDTSNGKAACRQHRNDEARSGRTLTYSAWYFYPAKRFPVNEMWNVFQFKSARSGTGPSDPFWTIETTGRPLRFALNWKGGDTDHTTGVRGPWKNSSVSQKEYRSRVRVPIHRWFKIRARLNQSRSFSGSLRVRINGKLVWSFHNIRTKWPNGDQRWSVNNYSNGLDPPAATIFIDDAVIAKP